MEKNNPKYYRQTFFTANLLTSRFVMLLLTLPRVTEVCDNFRLSSLNFHTTTASCPPNINTSSRKVEKAKQDATNGRAEVRLLTEIKTQR